MDAFMDCFFDKVFSDLDRDSLLARYKRRSMVDQLSTVIEGCSRGEGCDAQIAVRKAVMSAIRLHESNKKSNGSICLMGKFHNILYVAAKLCYDWQLRDTATVGLLLDTIYSCEGTFERLLMGALFGSTAPYFLAGWKSDFKDQDENLRALVYFLDHASVAGTEYPSLTGGDPIRFIDVPIESCGHASAVKLVLQLGAPDILLILLRFGAVVSEDARTSGLECLLDRMQEHKRAYPFNLVACLKLLLRVVISVRVAPAEPLYVFGTNEERDAFADRYPHFVEDGIVPGSRCARTPPELKHLCRCAIRYRLWMNCQLPYGITALRIPDTLKRYLDLMLD